MLLCHLISHCFPFPDSREVIVGEHEIGIDPDCSNGYCTFIQKFAVEKVIQHDTWNPAQFKAGNDIALVRINGTIRMGFVSASSRYIIGCILNIDINLFSPGL